MTDHGSLCKSYLSENLDRTFCTDTANLTIAMVTIQDSDLFIREVEVVGARKYAGAGAE